jgi:hypothetical protein
MLQTRIGHHSPITPAFRYEAGKSYWIPSQLAKQYIAQGIAMEDKSIEVPETKVKKKTKLFKKVAAK